MLHIIMIMMNHIIAYVVDKQIHAKSHNNKHNSLKMKFLGVPRKGTNNNSTNNNRIDS